MTVAVSGLGYWSERKGGHGTGGVTAGCREGVARDQTPSLEWKTWLLQQGALAGMLVERVLRQTCG